ncbi:hypothetical protein DSECCO2_636700 [anaerobic digester metagenome]
MNTFYLILSIAPLFVIITSMVLLLIRFLRLKQRFHFFLFLVFLILSFNYLFIVVFCLQMYDTAAFLFPLKQPVNLLLIPFSSVYGYIIFLGDDVPLRKMIPHTLPALFVFICFIPFWFLTKEIQVAFLEGEFVELTKNPIIHNTIVLRLVSIYVIFNAQLIIYNVIMIRRFIQFEKKQEVQLHAHRGAGSLAIVLVFFTFLLVLINNAYFLGVSKDNNSSVFFNVVSVLVLTLVFITGYSKKRCIASEDLESASADSSEIE